MRLAGVLDLVQPHPAVRYLTLHASRDDFHASLPLDQVQQRGMFIYERAGQPLDDSAGGPLRFTIEDFASCQHGEIDECANVKFVDRIELSVERGLDTRPSDEDEHEALHRRP
ncbi:MAG: molybdopterin-dependent oxidoreductase [Planctomycetales bacterium]|nr:molybdopterin-dependent oxidoreductase [Planctomycetales bacterium]